MRPGATANKLSSTNANVRKHKRKCARARPPWNMWWSITLA